MKLIGKRPRLIGDRIDGLRGNSYSRDSCRVQCFEKMGQCFIETAQL